MKFYTSCFVALFLCSGQTKGQSLVKINIKAKKLAYDHARNFLYATVESQDSLYGNQLVAIDAATGYVARSMFVGSEPGVMALTSDCNYLFIGFDATSLVKKIDLTQFSINSQINLSPDTYNGSRFAYDLATIPGNNDVVIVSQVFQAVDPPNAGIVAYKNQQLLPSTYSDYNLPIEFDAKNGRLYGYDNVTSAGGLATYTVDSVQGITKLNSTVANLGNGQIKCAKNYLFSSLNNVMDLSTTPPYQAGAFSYTSAGWGLAFAVSDSAVTYYISETDNTNLKVTSFNVSTFTMLSQVTYSNIVANSDMEAIEMEDIGTSSYAVILKNTYNATFGYDDQSQILLKVYQPDVGLEKYTFDNSVSVYPNPVSERITISLRTGSAAQEPLLAYLTDLSGRQLLQTNLTAETTIDLSPVEKGIYFLTVEKTGSGQKLVKKIVKE